MTNPNRVEPDNGLGLFQGDIGVAVFDASTQSPTFILKTASTNAIDVSLALTGMYAPNYHNADAFSITAYFEQATGGTDQVIGPVNFTGSQGDLSGNNVNFPPAVNPTLTRILIPPATIPAGVYRLTVLLTHTPATTNPRVFGFVEYGMVEMV